jgi:WD40 repeat protein
VHDLAWHPDSIHFASCGRDSKICMWSINESGKYFKLAYLVFSAFNFN